MVEAGGANMYKIVVLGEGKTQQYNCSACGQVFIDNQILQK